MALREKLIIGATGLVLLVGYSGLNGCSNKRGIENIVEKPSRIEQPIPSRSEELAQIYKKIDTSHISHVKKEKYKGIYRSIDMNNLSQVEKSNLEDIKNVNYTWDDALQTYWSFNKPHKQFPWLELKLNNDEFCLDTKNLKDIDIVFLSRLGTKEFYEDYDKSFDESFKREKKLDEKRMKRGGCFELSQTGYALIKVRNKNGIKEALIKDKDGNVVYDVLWKYKHGYSCTSFDDKGKLTERRYYINDTCTIFDDKGNKIKTYKMPPLEFLSEELFSSDTEGQIDPTKRHTLVIIDDKGKKREIRSTSPDYEKGRDESHSQKIIKSYLQISRKGFVAVRAYDEDGIKKAFIKDQNGDVVSTIYKWPTSSSLMEKLYSSPSENIEERLTPSEIKIDPTKKYTLVIIDSKGEEKEIQSTHPSSSISK